MLESLPQQDREVFKKFINDWINALRSGKYEQTKREWKNNEGCFCATGVALEIANKGVWVTTISKTGLREIYYVVGVEDFSYYCLSHMSYIIGKDITPPTHLLSVRLFDAIMRRNDAGESFEEISTYLEDCIKE